jgi:hypothetical protein
VHVRRDRSAVDGDPTRRKLHAGFRSAAGRTGELHR